MVRSAQETRPTRVSSSGPPRISVHRQPLRRRSRRDGPPDCVRNQQHVLVRGSEPQRSPPPAAKPPPTSAQPSHARPHRGRPDQQPLADLDPRARTPSVTGPRGVGGRQSRFCRPASAGCWHGGARWPVRPLVRRRVADVVSELAPRRAGPESPRSDGSGTGTSIRDGLGDHRPRRGGAQRPIWCAIGSPRCGRRGRPRWGRGRKHPCSTSPSPSQCRNSCSRGRSSNAARSRTTTRTVRKSRRLSEARRIVVDR
jgi:hypothetical protein